MEEQELSVSRMVASMNITIRGLELLGESNRGVYSLVVHETASRLDFEGRYGGDPASYAFTPSFEVGKIVRCLPLAYFLLWGAAV